MESQAEAGQPLQGMRILVADDEYLIAVTIEETLREAGADVVSAATLPAALKAAQDRSLSIAILDVRLGRQTTEAVADVLSAQGTPFMFYSGQTLPDSVRSKYPTVKMLIKPVRQAVFVTAVVEAIRD